MTVHFVQTVPKSNRLLDYYTSVYQKVPGYQDTILHGLMEIPTWIAVYSGMIGHRIPQKLYFSRDVQRTVDMMFRYPRDTYLFSVMEINKKHVKEIIERSPITSRIILGGYVDPATLGIDNAWNVHWANSPEELKKLIPGVNPKAPPNYGFFENWKTIPRLMMSEGCLFDCAFCTISRTLTVLDDDAIWKQVEAIRKAGIHFEYMYISDKTFGQAGNWELIGEIRAYIDGWNPDFLGFIVQTTANMPIKPWQDKTLLEEWYRLGVRVVEIGVETPDDVLLKKLNKPYRSRTLNQMTDLFREFGKMRFIPNLIFGIPGDDYSTLTAWLRNNLDIITFANVTVLADYFDGKGDIVQMEDRVPIPDNSLDIPIVDDQCQQSVNRSWLTPEEQAHTVETMESVLSLMEVNAR